MAMSMAMRHHTQRRGCRRLLAPSYQGSIVSDHGGASRDAPGGACRGGGGLFLLATRAMRDYPIQPLVRNHAFLRKGFAVEKEWSLGIELRPSEVKSIRERNVDISAAFGEFYKNELFLHQMHVPVWRHGLIGRPEPTRVRKLLANRSELKRMQSFMQHPNAHLIPARLEVGNTGWIKVIVAQCIKQNNVDTRKRDAERDVKRQLRDW